MEVLLVILCIILACGFAFDKATGFVKQLKSGSAKLSKGFEARLSIAPLHKQKESEDSATNTSSPDDN